MNSLQSSYTKNKTALWLILALTLFLSAAAGLCLGSVPMSLRDVAASLLGLNASSSLEARIVLFSRLPRSCAALLSGAALASAGAVTQTVLNNPLASTGTLGINSGAALAVALSCAISPAALGYVSIVAFVGAMLSMLLILLIMKLTDASRGTIILAGVAVSNLFGAGIDALITIAPDALSGVSDFRIGGFSGVTMQRIFPAGLIIILALAALLLLSRRMEILSLGADTAASLGLAVRPTRMLLLCLAAALSAAAVSFSGLLGFVGLIVPHIMRKFCGEGSLRLLLSSALGGASFVCLCDLIARTLFAPYELPVGIILAFVGAPFFLWLLIKRKAGEK